MPYTQKQLEEAAKLWSNLEFSITDIAKIIGGNRSKLAGYMVRNRDQFPKRGRQTKRTFRPAPKPIAPQKQVARKKPPLPKAQPEMKPDPTPVEFTEPPADFGPALTIFKELKSRECKWIMSSETTPETPTCGRRTDEGESFCAFHSKLAYVPVAVVRARRKVS